LEGLSSGRAYSSSSSSSSVGGLGAGKLGGGADGAGNDGGGGVLELIDGEDSSLFLISFNLGEPIIGRVADDRAPAGGLRLSSFSFLVRKCIGGS